MKKALIRWMEKFQKDERGMTLVELLAVVVILAIVGLIAFISIGNVIENSRQDAHIANAQQVISATELYEASGGDVNEVDADFGNMNTIDEIIDPWDNSTDSLQDFTISLEEDDIAITSSNSNCEFGAQTKSQLADQGRELCEDNS